MPPYLKTISKSFADVTIENGVDISEFLEASESITSAFDRFELSALTVVKDDVKKNIQKVRDWYEDAPDQHISTLEQLVVTEQAQTIQERKTTQGLLWLIRGFSFICKALQYSQDEPEEELTASFTKSYDETLKKHHNPIVEATFKISLKVCPSRADFYHKLAIDPSDPNGSPPQSLEIINEELKKWLSGLERIVVQLEKFYMQGGYAEGL